ncbi:FAD/NAD(P)-binding domain-containing protein [Xylariaceae sp. FL1272]|nr:FAD/NAD(P)-binding domain-containing protein [Xylariaceae sp. FL1272]
MKVIIIGAGIGGLSSAITLGQAGHDVEIYESSSFLNEVGAAVALGPNATRLLKDWGCDFELLHSVRIQQFAQYRGGKAEIFRGNELQIALESFEDKNLAVHRGDLHNCLRQAAEKTAKLHLKSKVASVDPIAGTVHFEDGSSVQGDLIVGADGLHSRTVEAVVATGREKVDINQNCFRFLVPVEKLKNNPVTAHLVNAMKNTLLLTVHPDRRIILYPCRSGTLFNCAAFYPANETSDDSVADSSWLNSADRDELVARFSVSEPAMIEVCKIGEDLKLWRILTRDPPPSFVKGKLALVGDAAHPMPPHQAQGAAQSIEDAAALGAAFSGGATPIQVEDLLQVYNEARYSHAVTISIMSRAFNERFKETADTLKKFLPNATMPESSVLFAWSSRPDDEVKKIISLRKEQNASSILSEENSPREPLMV